MGKRSQFERRKNDAYDTPVAAVGPLIPHLPIRGVRYYEPCAGNHKLVEALFNATSTGGYSNVFHCVGTSDVEKDARTTQYGNEADLFITNPPWSRDVLHAIIDNLRKQKDTWLLFDAGWMHTVQAKEYLKHCARIVSVGRVKWIANSQHTSLDDCCWYLFKNGMYQPVFYGR